MNSWELVQKELAINGIKLSDERCQFYDSKDNLQTKNVPTTIKYLKKQVEKDIKTLRFLWRETVDLLHEQCTAESLNVDSRLLDLFIYSLKSLAKFIEAFEDLDNTHLKKIVLNNLAKDIADFSSDQIKLLPDFKLAIDWTHRQISKSNYLVDLLRFASAGELYANSFEIKTARSVGGPWGNLDLPMLERVWPWRDEDENLRGRMKDIRRQRRYRMGLENYNTPDVGEGFYWRELRNEPYSWYNRHDDQPYYERYVLTRD